MPTTTGPERLNGSSFSIFVDGTNYDDNITAVKLENDDADSKVVTAADVKQGGGKARKYTFKISMLQSLTSGSLWRAAWDLPGTKVAFRFAPKGNDVATADQPHITGTLKLGNRPDIGGDVEEDGEDFVSEVEWDVVGEPVLDEGTVVPAVALAVPAGAAAGQIVTLIGQNFAGTTGVKFGSTNAPVFRVESSQKLLVVVPTGVSGATSVTVTNAKGTSAGFSVTAA